MNYGGAQTFLLLLARWTPQDAYRSIACVLQPGHELKNRLESSGIRVICLNRPRPSIFQTFRFVSYIYRNIRDVVGICRHERVQVVHCHLSDAEFLGILAGFLARVECILTTVHYPDLLPRNAAFDSRNLLRRWFTRVVYLLADCIIAVSEEVAHNLVEVFRVRPERIHVLRNGVEIDSGRRLCAREQLVGAPGLSAQHKVITSVARLVPLKGHARLLEAMHELLKTHTEIRLLILGDGEQKEQLMRQCQQLGIAHAVHFLGNRSDVRNVLALSDIFVLPSYWEGTSMALLEAMAAGKAIVASDVPGNRALIEHGKTGLLAPPGDAVALAHSLGHLLGHPEVASELGSNAGRVARERFDIRQTVAELRRLWRG